MRSGNGQKTQQHKLAPMLPGPGVFEHAHQDAERDGGQQHTQTG